MINNEQAICVKTETDIPERPPPEYVVLSEFLDPVFKILHTSFRNAILAQNY
jgi:hypothetical protein